MQRTVARILSRQRRASAMSRTSLLMSIPIIVCCLHLAPTSALALSTTPLVTMTETQAGDLFGFAVSGAGDLNGDGYPDAIVGAYKRDNPPADAGAVDVFFGGASPDATPDLTMNGESGENLGFALSAGDVNGDGYPDVIAGGFGYSGAAGEVLVYFGGPAMDAVADWAIEGITGEGLGYTVSYAGDVNGDGYGDIIAGNAANTNAYVFYGGVTPDSAPDLTLSNDGIISVSGAGDVNGDGYADFIAGGVAEKAYVYFGGPGVDAVPDLTLTGSGGDSFGYSVASAGDVNGDGKSDVIVGAIFGAGPGRAYVYYGGATPDAIADLTLTGEVAGDQFGFSVSSAGDMNADGYSDMIVGAPYNDAAGTDAGRAYLYLGGPSADAVADVTMTGALAIDSFGYSVSSADMNHDGHSDLIVGMYTTTPGNQNHVYVKSLTLPDVSQSYYVPQSGTVGSPSEGATAIRNLWTCPNNDGLPNNARIKLVIKDSAGNPITNVLASDTNIRFNGGTPGPSPGQGFTGPDADSIIANSQYNPLANCPDVRKVPGDAPSDANGVAYLTFKGASPSNPGVAVRDPNRKWGHYDTEIPVYVMGVKLQGRLTSGSSNGSYVLEIKNVDVVGGLTITPNQGELVNTLDRSPMQLHQGEPDSAAPINWWLDLNSDGLVNALDNSPQQAHFNHNCSSPSNP